MIERDRQTHREEKRISIMIKQKEKSDREAFIKVHRFTRDRNT